MQERRAHPRFSTHESGVLLELEGGLEVREQVVSIMNASAFGIGVQIDRPIAVGKAVKVYVTDCVIVGKIVYCREEGDGFAAGIAMNCDAQQVNQLLLEAQRRR